MTSVRDGGLWKEVVKFEHRDGGMWKAESAEEVRTGGVWKQYHGTETLLPASTVTGSGWTVGGTSPRDVDGDGTDELWEQLHEPTPDEGETLVETSDIVGGGAESFEVDLEVADQGHDASQTHTVRVEWRNGSVSGTGATTLTAELRDSSGTTLDATSGSERTTTNWVIEDLIMDASSIADWDGLHLWVQALNSGGSGGSVTDTVQVDVSYAALRIEV